MAKKKKAAKKKVVKKKVVKKKVAKKTKTRKSSGSRKTSGLNQLTYTLSDELQAVCGAKKLTRPQVVKQLWAYIKSHKCQDAKNKRMIVPDKRLEEVIGKKPVDMLKLAGHLSKHLQ